MIALVIFVSLSLGTLLGWFGHKVSLRIAVWGIQMNEQDRVLQEIAGSGIVPDEFQPQRAEAVHLAASMLSAKPNS